MGRRGPVAAVILSKRDQFMASFIPDFAPNALKTVPKTQNLAVLKQWVFIVGGLEIIRTAVQSPETINLVAGGDTVPLTRERFKERF